MKTDSQSKGYKEKLEDFFGKEMEEIRERRCASSISKTVSDRPTTSNELVGLALSGGGIRSATFNLGLIQALFRNRVLRHVDYLSTVSGGGYIGSCLTTLLNSCSNDLKDKDLSCSNDLKDKDLWGPENFPFEREVQVDKKKTVPLEDRSDPAPGTDSGQSVASDAAEANTRACEPERSRSVSGRPGYGNEKAPVKHLRYYSNYLVADTNGFIGYLRPFMTFFIGVVLNLIMLIPYLAAIGFALSIYFGRVSLDPEPHPSDNLGRFEIDPLAFFDTSANGPAFHLELELWFDDDSSGRIPPFHIDVLTQPDSSGILKSFHYTLEAYRAADSVSVAEVLATLDSSAYIQCTPDERLALARLVNPRIAVLQDSLKTLNNRLKRHWYAMLPLPLLILLLVVILYFVGGWILRTRLFNPKNTLGSSCSKGNWPFRIREFFSQFLTGLFAIPVLLFAVPLYGAAIAYWRYWQLDDSIGLVPLLGLISARILQPLISSSEDGRKSPIARAFPIVIGFLGPAFLLWALGYFIWMLVFSETQLWKIGLYITAGLVISCFFVNLNIISPNGFYRDRLSRAYLIRHRSKESAPSSPFKTVEHHDALPLSKLCAACGPFHIINTTLSLSQKLPEPCSEADGVFRTGECFILSKHYCGSRETGYRATSDYEDIDAHLNLGTAMAISAAAANIGMAQNNIWWLRFLMALLNIRLGYWIRKPDSKVFRGSWYRIRPPSSWEAVKEILGSYNLHDEFINISDGGHFENLGVYELLRRRCKYIIVGDAEADPDMTFPAMSTLIRLARIDFGIEIEIDLKEMKRDTETELSNAHCAVGRITYPSTVDGLPEEFGYLLYCKTSMTGDETTHLQEYRSSHSDFPQQSTGDQFFDERQFEAYRELGYHVGKQAFEPASFQFSDDLMKDDRLEDIFHTLRQFWHPHSKAVDANFTRHGEEFNRIITEIRKDADLAFLDEQIYPEWPAIRVRKTSGVPSSGPANNWLPPTDAERRKGFYICTQMIQFMENVYTDLNLEFEYDHPDNRGWMNLFKHWSWSGMFRVTWAVSASLFGAKFQAFCEKHLDMNLGKVCVEKVDEKDTASRLNQYECRLIDGKAELRKKDKPEKIEFDVLYRFILEVKEPLSSEINIRLPFGFALVKGQEIVYFRIQDHLRKMGLGRRALKLLIQSSCGIKDIAAFGRAVQYPPDTDRNWLQRHFDSLENR